jgi:hypothetical protein
VNCSTTRWRAFARRCAGSARLGPARPDNFALETSDAALSFFDELKAGSFSSAPRSPPIGLVVGAMVIMNIMLVAVAEANARDRYPQGVRREAA